MIREIAEQRRWETYLATGVMPFGPSADKYLTPEVREGVKRLTHERMARLDELARVIHTK